MYVPVSPPPQNSSIVSDWLYLLVGGSRFVAVMVALVLTFAQAILCNWLINRHSIAQETTFFIGLFYVLLTSFSVEMHTLSPELIGNTFLIIAMFQLFQGTRMSAAADKVFDVGFYIALASLCYGSYGLFLLFGLFGIISLRGFRLEEVIISICGFLSPFFLLGVYYFWHDSLGEIFRKEIVSQFGLMSLKIDWTWKNSLTLIFWTILLLYGVINGSVFFNRLSTFSQRYLRTLFWLPLVFAITIVLQSNLQISHLYLLSIPVSVFTAFNFINIKNRAVAEFLFLGMIILSLVFHYQELIFSTLEK
jgi:hypothetical protein